MSAKKQIKLHESPPEGFTYPDTRDVFIYLVSKMKAQAVKNIRKHDPSADSQLLDAELRGYLKGVEDVIKVYKAYE